MFASMQKLVVDEVVAPTRERQTLWRGYLSAGTFRVCRISLAPDPSDSNLASSYMCVKLFRAEVSFGVCAKEFCA